MVEAGFTRRRIASNIIMKNLMDFCIGTCVFIPFRLEFCLVKMHLADLSELPTLGILPIMQILTGPILYLTWCSVATTATIVSGAMAERTKFLSYCIYSAVISLLLYIRSRHTLDLGGGWFASL